VRERGWKDKG